MALLEDWSAYCRYGKKYRRLEHKKSSSFVGIALCLLERVHEVLSYDNVARSWSVRLSYDNVVSTYLPPHSLWTTRYMSMAVTSLTATVINKQTLTERIQMAQVA